MFHILISDEELMKEVVRLQRALKHRRGPKARKSTLNNDLIRRGLEHPDTVREKYELGLLPTK